MNIRPLYDRIVVKRIEEERDRCRAVCTFPIPRKKSRRKAKWSPSARASAWKTARWFRCDVQVGDRILFGKYSGSDIKLDGEEYLIMREDEVLGILDAQPVSGKEVAEA